MARTRRVAGNWKMHGSRSANRALLDAILKGLPELYKGGDAQCVACPPFPYLGDVAERLRGTPIAVGAQNVSEHAQGAYTGEVSAAMLAEFGCRYVIVGHSERRQLYGESDAHVAAKFAAVRSAGLTPILCVGETEEERDRGETQRKLRHQVQEDLMRVETERLDQVVIAYEPIWAIGTGRVAAPEQAQDAMAFVRALVGDRDADQAGRTRVLYGGSVKPDNCGELLSQPEVDGALVGGASLDPDSFAAIVASVR